MRYARIEESKFCKQAVISFQLVLMLCVSRACIHVNNIQVKKKFESMVADLEEKLALAHRRLREGDYDVRRRCTGLEAELEKCDIPLHRNKISLQDRAYACFSM